MAVSDDIAAAIGPRLSAQQQDAAVESELLGYLDQDDMAGAMAFVERLAAEGRIDATDQRLLEDRIWRIKTERTLDYARKVREAIRDSDLEMMREYNTRMQRLMAGTRAEPVQADIVDDDVDGSEPVPSHVAVGDVEVVALEVEDVETTAPTRGIVVEPEPNGAEAIAPAPDRRDAIADLLGRGEAAIATYRLTIASEGKDSALDIVVALASLGDDGQSAAQELARKIMARYEALIERDLGRGRLDKAATFAERMDEVAREAGLPRDEIVLLSARVEQAAASREGHARLVRDAERLREQGKLVGPSGDYALALAAKTVKLGFDPAAGEALLNSIIRRQYERANRLKETGRLREAGSELNLLADALLSADIDRTALVADFRVEAATLYRQADRRDSERERRAAATAHPANQAPVDDEDENPFTFINPF